MDTKAVDKAIKLLIKNCSISGHRSLFIIVGENARDNVPLLHRVLGKGNALSVLWCSKQNSEGKKNSQMQAIDTFITEDAVPEEVSHFKPYYCDYSGINKILGHSFHMAVMSDFEAMVPNLLASIIGTVKKSGSIVFLVNKISKIEQLCNIKMDCHKRFHVKADQDFVSLFNERFANSLSTCQTCVVLDDDLNVLKLYSKSSTYPSNLKIENNLMELKEKHGSEEHIGVLLKQCHTLDQANLLLKFLDVLKKKTFHASVVTTSPHGCGKSAALGLAIAGSIALNYSNIFVSSLCFDNVKILFKFLFKGLDVLGYKENDHYDVIESVNPEFNKSLIGLNIFKDHPQAVRFIQPVDVEDKLHQAELVVIDEVAAIPPHLLKHFIGSYIVLMSATTSGYGAVGQTLYNNAINTFGVSSITEGSKHEIPATALSGGDIFHKISLSEPIHYYMGDCVDSWLNNLLCLKASITPHLSFGCPHPEQCVLYYVTRETLFSCNPIAETFLHSLASLFASSKRQNTADFLIEMADAPDYHIFCLLPPSSNSKKTSPEILCAILVHVEQTIPQNIVYCGANQAQPLPICLSDWTFKTKSEEEILRISGIHILDLVTHPEFQRMGYGLKAFQLLQEFYEGKFISLNESSMFSSIHISEKIENNIKTSQPLQPLLRTLSEIQPDQVCYFLASYGLTSSLLKFWKKAGFVPVYITKEIDSSGEHMIFMLKGIGSEPSNFSKILHENWRSFHEYFYILLSSECKNFSPSLSLSLLTCNLSSEIAIQGLTKADIDVYIKPRFMKSLEKYDENQKDLHCIMPIIPVMSKLYFRRRFKNVTLSYVQEAILLCMGLQRKTIDEISADLNLPPSQIYALLNRSIKRIRKHLTDIIEQTVEKNIAFPPSIVMEPISEDLDHELADAANKIRKEIEHTKNIQDIGFSTYAIKGSEEEWKSALQSGRKTLVSIKSIKKPDDVDYHRSTNKRKLGKSKNKISKGKKR